MGIRGGWGEGEGGREGVGIVKAWRGGESVWGMHGNFCL